MWARRDPGPCPICGAPHTACTASSGPIAVPQLPQRDTRAPVTPAAAPLEAERIQETLPPDQVTTGTYRPKRRR